MAGDTQPVRPRYQGHELQTLDDLLTAAETAELLRMTFDGFRYRLYNGGDLPPSIKVGRHRLWRRSEINDWIDRQYLKQIS
jgi:predicted DNA-binding transcriptional regulator AlpA